ncbi:hypothetical protein [Actinocatenispora rupis]|nr:hypothetical protein [Actinocatenispora rupis]
MSGWWPLRRLRRLATGSRIGPPPRRSRPAADERLVLLVDHFLA